MIQNESLSRDRDKEGSGKRMKRRISKRIIAIGMSLCVAFSIMPLSVSAEAETAAPAVKQNNLWVSTGKTFVNRIYTVGLYLWVSTCAAYGSALQYFEILYRGRNAAVRAGRRESDQKIPQS